jgi:hypothetical protein
MSKTIRYEERYCSSLYVRGVSALVEQLVQSLPNPAQKGHVMGGSFTACRKLQAVFSTHAASE